MRPRLVLLVLLSGAAVPAAAQTRLGLGPELYLERSRLVGEQWIGVARIDESDRFRSSGRFAGSAWATFEYTKALRLGGGLRTPGMYGGCDRPGCNDPFQFGLYFQAFGIAEYGLRAGEKIDLVLGGRAGLGLLFPSGELAAEITRLRTEGVDVWNVPRVGWLVAVSAGARRQMTKRLWLRADLTGEWSQLILFATRDRVEDILVRKKWRTTTLRYGFALGLELTL